jgi:Ca2+-binding RTX toxin-like protein
MALQYDTPSSLTDFQTSLAANSNLSTATQDAISKILENSETVTVGSFDGTNLVAPANVQAVVADIAGNAGEKVVFALPADAMASANVWVFNSEADLTVAFNNVERVIASGSGNDTVIVAGEKNAVLDGAAGNDSLDTSGGNDSITGGAGDDSISSATGNDTIVSGEGNDTIDAGTGFDVVAINAAASDYDFTVANGSLVVTAKDGSASVVATNAEVFSFEGNENVIVTTNETNATAMRLYQGLFDRSVDVEGAEYWLDLLDEGTLSLGQVAEYFVVSPEFEAKGEIANDAFVEMLYVNALGRDSDAEGKEFWTNAIEASQLTQAQVAIEFVGSAGAAEEVDNVLIIPGLV